MTETFKITVLLFTSFHFLAVIVVVVVVVVVVVIVVVVVSVIVVTMVAAIIVVVIVVLMSTNVDLFCTVDGNIYQRQTTKSIRTNNGKTTKTLN